MALADGICRVSSLLLLISHWRRAGLLLLLLLLRWWRPLWLSMLRVRRIVRLRRVCGTLVTLLRLVGNTIVVVSLRAARAGIDR